RDVASVVAYSEDSSVNVGGDVDVIAVSDNEIEALVLAFSAAIAASGSNAFAVTGAGASAINRLGTDTKAYIDGSGANGVNADKVTIRSTDTSKIEADVAAGSLGIAGSGSISVTVSIAASVATNHLSNVVEAAVENATVTAREGAVLIEADVPKGADFSYDGRTNTDTNVDLRNGERVQVDGTKVYRFLGEQYQYTSEFEDPVVILIGDIVKVSDEFQNPDIAGKYFEATGNLGATDLGAALYTGASWRPVTQNLTTERYTDKERWKEETSISAMSIAASLSVGAGGSGGVALSGAGAESTNVLLSHTDAYASNSVLKSATDIFVKAANNASIDAVVVGASAAIGAGGTAGIGASFGVGISRNLMGFDLNGSNEPIRNQSTVNTVQAYLHNSSADAGQSLEITANSLQRIDSFVLAGSVAIGGGGTIGLAASGAGVNSENYIANTTKAYVDGDGAKGLKAKTIKVEATDNARIKADAVGASLAVGAGGSGSGSVSAAVTVANNAIYSLTEATIKNADNVQARDGNVTVSAQNATDAPMLSDLQAGTFNATQKNAAKELTQAALAAVSGVGGDVAEALDQKALADIYIDTTTTIEHLLDAALDFSSKEEHSQRDVAEMAAAKALLVVLFREQGIDLSGDLSDISLDALESGSEWLLRDKDSNAYVIKMSGAGAAITVAEATIDALALAASASIAASGGVSVALGASAAVATNEIHSVTRAGVENSYIAETNDLDVLSRSSAGIISTVVSISGSVGIGGGGGGGAASLGMSLVNNYVGVDPDLTIYEGTVTHDKRATVNTGEAESDRTNNAEISAYLVNSGVDATGDVNVNALSDQSIGAVVVSGSFGVAGGAYAGVALSGAGTQVSNQIQVNVFSYIDGDGQGIAAERVSLLSDDTSRISAVAAAASLAATGGLVAISGSVAATVSSNIIDNQIESYIANASNTVARSGSSADQDGDGIPDAPGIMVQAFERAEIESYAVAASVSLAFGIGGAFSGAGTYSVNTISTTVDASIRDSAGVTSEHGVVVQADSASYLYADMAAASLAGGIAAASASVNLGNNTARDTVNASIQRSRVEAIAGNIQVVADSTPITETLAVTVGVAAGIGVNANVTESKTVIDNNVNAFIDGAKLTAKAGTVYIDADADSDADPDVVSVSVGAISIDVINYTAEVKGSTNAYATGTGTTIEANAIEITADDISTSDPDITQVSVGAISVSIINATPTIDRSTRAYVDGPANLAAGASDVFIRANGKSEITTAISQSSVGLVTIGVLKLGGRIASDTEAYIGAGASVHTTGVLDVAAKSTPLLKSDVDQVAVALGAGIGSTTVNGTLEGLTTAYIDEAATVRAGSLDVSAEQLQKNGERTVVSDLLFVGVGGIVAVNVGEANATSTAEVDAHIGRKEGSTAALGAQADIEAGEISVVAVSAEDVYAEIKGGGGSIGIAASSMSPTATISGDVNSYIGENTKIIADQLSVTTQLQLDSGDHKTTRKAEAKALVASVGLIGAGGDVVAKAVNSGLVSSYIAGNTNLELTGAVTLLADATNRAKSEAQGGSGSIGISVSLFEARAIVGERAGDASSAVSQVDAHVADTAVVNAGSLTVTATSDSEAKTEMLVATVGLVAAGSGAKSTAHSNADTTAAVDGNITLSGGNIGIKTESTANADADVRGGSGSLVVGAANFTIEGTAEGKTASYIANGAVINNADQIDVWATGKGATADADVLVGAGGIVAVGVARAEANSRPEITAYIGEEVAIGQDTPVGGIKIKAEGRGEADSLSRSYGGGLVQVGRAEAVSNYNPVVSALIGTSSLIDATGDVTVTADLLKARLAEPPTDYIVSVNSDNTVKFGYPVTEGDVLRYEGGGTGGLQSDREYNVLLTGNYETSNEIQLGKRIEEPVVLTQAEKDDYASKGFDPAKFSDFIPVSAQTDVIEFQSVHRFRSGDAVLGGAALLESTESSPAGGVLYVRVIDDFTIRLVADKASAQQEDEMSLLSTVTATDNAGTELRMASNGAFSEDQVVTYLAENVASFDGDLVDIATTGGLIELKDENGDSYSPARWVPALERGTPPNAREPGAVVHAGHGGANNIYMPLHGFNNADLVTYFNNSAPADVDDIVGLEDGDTYRVIKNSNHVIKLTDKWAQVSGDLITTVAIPDGKDADGKDKTRDISEIALEAGHPALANGTRVTASSNGQVYFVINPDGDDTIRLATTSGGAPVKLSSPGSAYWLLGDAISIQSNSTNHGDHVLEKGVGGLRDGYSYYVTDVSGRDFNLANTGPNTTQTAIDLLPGSDNAAVRIGTLGVDLKSTNSAHTLYLDLSGNGQTLNTASHRFAGPGGVSLSSISPPPGDGISGATAKGGGGGIVAVNTPTAHMNATTTVTADISAQELRAAGTVTIDANAESHAKSYSTTGGGGAIAVGTAKALTNTTSANTTASVGAGSHIYAGDDFILRVDSDHSAEGQSSSDGGGLVATNNVDASGNVTFANISKVGDDAQIVVEDAIGIYANSSSFGKTHTRTESWGLGAKANSNEDWDDNAAGVHITGSTLNQVGEGAVLQGDSVDIAAHVDRIEGDSYAYAKAINPVLFGYAEAYAEARVALNSTVADQIGLSLDGDASGNRTEITGYRGVDITSSSVTPNVITGGGHLAVALIPPQEFYDRGSKTSAGYVDADDNVLVKAGVRDESRSGGTITLDHTALQSGTALSSAQYDNHGANDTALALFVDVSGSGRFYQIGWDADVVILGGKSGRPELAIDETGKITKLNNVKVWDKASEVGTASTLDVGKNVSGDGDYYVQAINDGYGDIVFGATGKNIQRQDISNYPVFVFRDNLENVSLIDHSTSDMHIVDVDVIYRGSSVPLVHIETAQSSLDAFDSGSGAEEFGFDLRHSISVNPSIVDVQKLGLSGDIILDGEAKANFYGEIVNPTGWTRVLNSKGDIYGLGASSRIESNILHIEAIAGHIGKSVLDGDIDGRVNVDLVRSTYRPEFGDTPTGDRTEALNAFSGKDAVMSIQTFDRRVAPVNEGTDEPSPPDLTVIIDTVVAGGLINLLVQDSQHQPGSGGSGEIRVHVENEGHNENYTKHFYPEGGEPLLKDPAAFIDGTTIAVNTYYQFTQAHVTQDRGNQSEFRFSGVTAYTPKLTRNAVDPLAAGLIAGETITVNAEGAGTDAPFIDIYALTDILNDGHINVDTDSHVYVEEIEGDLRVGKILSQFDSVELLSPASILDAAPDDQLGDKEEDVIGVNITMTALAGTIGTDYNFLEIDSSYSGEGALTADATGNIRIEETLGDLRVNRVTSSGADVTLATLTGSILDGNDELILDVDGVEVDAANVEATNVDLSAIGGGIGAEGDDLDIDTGIIADVAHRAYMEADGDIYVTESNLELNLLGADSRNGDVRITIPDTSLVPTLDRGKPWSNTQVAEDLFLEASGEILLSEVTEGERGVFTPIGYSLISAFGSISLWVGDNIATRGNSQILAGAGITIRGDSNRLRGFDENADTGFGTNMDLRGLIGGLAGEDTAKDFLTEIHGHDDVDLITFNATELDARTRVYGSHYTVAQQIDDGEDEFVVNQIQSMNLAMGHTLTLDGQDNSDLYFVYTTGSQGAERDYEINVLDSGAKVDGADVLNIYGIDNTGNGIDLATGEPYASDDIFILRDAAFIDTDRDGLAEPDADPEHLAFVALLHGDIDQVRTASGEEADRPQSVQRVNYDTNMNGRLNVYGLGGNDVFAVDNNSAITTLDGGAGDDDFQVGQLYGTPRVNDTERDVINVAAGDVFGTVATTRGYLSRGNSNPLVATGGSGNDTFTVYSNSAELRLEGDSGNDLFVVRAFALAVVDGNGDIILDENGVASPLIGTSLGNTTEIDSGSGADEIQYNINAPVSIDGGTGFDKVVVLGTEFADDFVISKDGIFGGGLNVRFERVELVEVDGLEGDDEFFVISTPFGVGTRIIGGLGSDTINITGDVTEDIVSRSLEGLSGSINHRVDSADLAYDGMAAPGVELNVATSQEGVVVIEDGKNKVVREDQHGGPDEYGIYLAVQPAAGTVVYVTVSAARSAQEEEDGTITNGKPADSILIDSDFGVANAPYDFEHTKSVNGTDETILERTVVLRFDADNWEQRQNVFIEAFDDEAAEGARTVTISHSTTVDIDETQFSDGAESALAQMAEQRAIFDQVAVRNVEVNVIDDDLPELIITESNKTTRVLEGDIATGKGIQDSYILELSTPPKSAADVVVSLTELIGEDDVSQIIIGSSDSRFNASSNTVTFSQSAGYGPVDITITAKDDYAREDTRVAVIEHSVTSTDTSFSIARALLDVEVMDNETAGIIIEESGGETLVSKNGTGDAAVDDYTVRLNSEPKDDASVTVSLLTDGQTDVVLDGRTFLHEIGRGQGDQQYTGSLQFADIDTADTITRTDGGSWAEAGFSEGQLVRAKDAGANGGDYKILSISGANKSVLTLRKTDSLSTATLANATLVRVAAAVTFTAADGANAWYNEVTVEVRADANYDKPEDRRYKMEFAVRPHLLSDLRGPLEIAGGVRGERSLREAILLPEELNGPFVEIGEQPPEGEQIDVINVYDDSSQENKRGLLTATSLTGFHMAAELDFDQPTAFGEPGIIPGGITYGDPDTGTTEIEIFNLYLGAGNNRLDITDTLHTDAAHGGLTTVHGGGNTPLSIEGRMSVTEAFSGGYSITRLDELRWERAQFLVGQLVRIGSGETAPIGEITAVSGSTLNVKLKDEAVLISGSRDLAVAVLDPETLDLETSEVLIGGDWISVSGGAGPDSPLVVYGDTSQDGRAYAGVGELHDKGIFGVKPFDPQSPSAEDWVFDFPSATEYDYDGNDIIDASALFLGYGVETLPTVGLTIYGGGGNDTLIGSQAGDHIAGGSGNDLIIGQRGPDHIYGDSGVNVDMINRILTVPTSNRSDAPNADGLVAGNDLVFGDFLPSEPVVDALAGDFDDIIFGDHGAIVQNVAPEVKLLTTEDVVLIETEQPNNSGSDEIHGNLGNDIIIGGGLGDLLLGEEANDLVFGDHARVETNVSGQGIDRQLLPMSMAVADHPFAFSSIFTTNQYGGGDDVIYGDNFITVDTNSVLPTDGEDILMGQQGMDTIFGGSRNDDLWGGHNVAGGHDSDDRLDGGSDDDVILGDNGEILRRGDSISPRYRELLGEEIYNIQGQAQVSGIHESDPDGTAARHIVILDHADSTSISLFGDDYIAGGFHDDVIFGQLGDDIVQGDGSIGPVSAPTAVDAMRLENGVLSVSASFEARGFDGDDYIEGNGGQDVIFGNLGQDDITGGNSNLYGLTTPQHRPDGEDILFGGAGIRILRNQLGEGGDSLISDVADHAFDADFLMGDNANILKLLDGNGAFLEFAYDQTEDIGSDEQQPQTVQSRGDLRVVVRAFELLDYSYGLRNDDRGASDLILGEDSDDVIQGMTGNDVLYGNGWDDDLYGGSGLDRIFGGSGEDGVVGDDGIIRTSRGSVAESLYGIAASTEQLIDIPGPFIGAWVDLDGYIKKTVDLINWEEGGSDAIYGGLGDDWIHAGAGNDAVSGAEALLEFYIDTNPSTGEYFSYDAATGILGFYDAENPRPRVAYDPVTDTIELYGPDNTDPTAPEFLLNFSAFDANGDVIHDGKDRIFGDLGHDAIFGGTGHDRLFGGFGDDYLQLDDNLDTNGGLNDTTDDATQPAVTAGAADFAYGGGGRDVLIANTGADRMFDWTGEYNSFLVPFARFGAPTVNRLPSPHVIAFIEDLGNAAGTDPNRIEPHGELGLVTQKDPEWGDVHGAPRDGQPGNLPTGQYDTDGAPEDDRTLAPLQTAHGSTPVGNVIRPTYTIDIEKAINAANPLQPTALEDADLLALAPEFGAGTPITWTYLVSNAGLEALGDVVVMDDAGTAGDSSDDFKADYVSGDANSDGLLQSGETWLYTSALAAPYVAEAGEYVNAATVTAISQGSAAVVSDIDLNHHIGLAAVVRIEKAINAVDPTNPTLQEDADFEPGVLVDLDEQVTWTYQLFNDGIVALSIDSVVDDNGTEDIADDFAPTAVLAEGLATNIGDLNQDGLLDIDEIWQYTSAGVDDYIVVAGAYANTATVTASLPLQDDAALLTDTDLNHHFGTLVDALHVEKAINAVDPLNPTLEEDADEAPGAQLFEGDTVVWTYLVSNTLDTAIDGATLILSDDAGTLDVVEDDFKPLAVLAEGKTTNLGDLNEDGWLDMGESWLYTSSGLPEYQAVLGEYVNEVIASAETQYLGEPLVLMARDLNNHVAVAVPPSIQIEKAINAIDASAPTAAEDADTAELAVAMLVDTAVTWTYLVSNTGTETLANVTVTDDHGATLDDFAPVYISGDTNADELLDVDEQWLFTSAGDYTVVAGAYVNSATANATGSVSEDAVEATDLNHHLGIDATV
ncbi:MAG: hypothetical protein V7720_09160, partial [Halioglobus sp.]